jgi:hypothetical protein
MRWIIESVLISAAGGMDFQGVPPPGSSSPTTFLSFGEDAYMRDDLGVLEACDAMLMD